MIQEISNPALEAAGQAGADGIRAYIDSHIPPPNSPVTVHGGWIPAPSTMPSGMRSRNRKSPLSRAGVMDDLTVRMSIVTVHVKKLWNLTSSDPACFPKYE